MSFALGVQGDIGWDPGDVAEILYTEYEDAFIPAAESFLLGWTFQGVSVTKGPDATPVIGERLVPKSGSSSAKGHTCNSALLVRKNTAGGGRKNRGRMFVVPFDLEEEIVDIAGQILPAEVANYQIQWNAFQLGIETAGVFPWLLHSDSADAPTPITSFSVQTLLATQRRRMR